LAGCGGGESAGARRGSATAPPVEAVQARTGSLPLVERLSGTVLAENQVALFPEISGRIAEVLVQNGAAVAAGQPLVRLGDEAVREQVRQAEAGHRIGQARLRQAQARLAEVEAQVRRMRSLGERNLVSEVELETLLAQRESAAADVDLAQAQLEQAAATLAERRDDLARTWVRAPVAGVVGDRRAEVGMQVSTSTRLFTLGNLDRVTVRVVVTDAMLRYLEPGQPVRIHADGAGSGRATIAATLTRISPFLNEVTRSAEAEILLDNSGQRLRPGMFVPVDILYGQSRQATLVPLSALFTDTNTGREGVFVAQFEGSIAAETEGELSAPVPVEFRPLLPIARGAAEVAVDTVPPGAWVVTLGQNLLATGRSQARLRPVTWEHVMSLQDLRREDLLADVLRATGARVAQE
jgi:HlyD family secretion protein